MIDKKGIIAMARQVAKRSRGYKERKSIDPRREWFLGIGLFLVIAIVGGIFNARNYVYFTNIEKTVVEKPIITQNYQANQVQTALEIYSNKASEFNRLASDVPAPLLILGSNSATTSTSTVDIKTNLDLKIDDDTPEAI